jgi:uncharacterized protein YbaR (Trm112 family)
MPFEFESSKEFLRCPASLAELVRHGERLVCVDPDVRLSYPIKDGIPILLKDEATELGVDEWQAIMRESGRGV